MTKNTYKAFRVLEENGSYVSSIEEMELTPPGKNEILVRVHYSSLNFKDALSASGNKGVTKQYPHTPGIDAAGVVEASNSGDIQPGAEVIVTGFDLGMNTDGGFAEYIKVPAEWAVKMPENLTMKEAMIYGTAGFTAGCSVLRLSELVKPGDGKIIVSGATGGVGSVSVAILSKLGYHVVAITGKSGANDFLKDLGASEIISREEMKNHESRPLLKPSYAGAIDTVGGPFLENILKSIKPMGAVTCCGNAASPNLELTVYPFILRSVTLMGIASQNYPMESRPEVWSLLSNHWKPTQLLRIYDEIPLEALKIHIELILQGKITGRTVVKLID